MTKYIWQKDNWTNFFWKPEEVIPLLMKVKKMQGYILAKAEVFELKELAEIITEEAFTTSTIEGESLDKDSIRSSVARRLGLPTAGLPNESRNSDGLVELLIDATTEHNGALKKERLFGWQASLFPTGFSGIHKIEVGKWRSSKTPMQVISGAMGNEKVHYEAPPAKVVNREMTSFLKWWNNSPRDLDGIIRAGVAHFWFITVHPFEDGNGRLARAITDMALAQDEKTSKRLYSLSSQIIKDKKNYYDILERAQKEDGDLTEWLVWFLEMFTQSIESSMMLIEKSLFIDKFFKYYRDTKFNERQLKVIKKLLEKFPDDLSGGLTNKKYVAMTKVSSETAKRDIKGLVDIGILLLNDGKGRSTSYRINRDV